MTRTLIVIAAFLTLSVPAALAVPPADKGKPEKPGKQPAAPGQSAEKNAAKACKAERGDHAQHGGVHRRSTARTPNKANAFGKCVSAQAKKAEEPSEAEEQEEAKENAAKKCKKERGTSSDHRGVPARSTARTRTGRTPSASACRSSRRLGPTS